MFSLRRKSNFVLLWVKPSYASSIEDASPCPKLPLASLVENKLTTHVKDSLWLQNSFLLSAMPVVLPVPCGHLIFRAGESSTG